MSTKVVDIIIENVQILSEKLDDKQVKYCVKCLSDHPLFCGLTTEELTILCAEMVWAKATKN